MKSMLFFAAVGLGFLFLGAGCSDKDESSQDISRASLEIVQEDIAKLDTANFQGVEHLDSRMQKAYVAMLGGKSGTDFKKFLAERTKIFVTLDDESLRIFPAKFKHEGWLKSKDEVKDRETKESSGLIWAAQNLGTLLWMRGAVDETPVVLYRNNQQIDITSSRIGLIVLGEVYTDIFKYKGRRIPISYNNRIGTLGHEGRHSDCTKGLSKKGIEVARKAEFHDDFLKEFPDRACGYLHSRCVKGNAEGLLACDDKPWGAYSLTWLFDEAMARQPDISSAAWQHANAVALDSKSRLEFSTDEMLDGKLGEPDMTSLGLLDS